MAWTAPLTVVAGAIISAGWANKDVRDNTTDLDNRFKLMAAWPTAPALGGSSGQSGQTYSQQTGYYVKVGNLVVAQFTIILSNKGTISGNLLLLNLPFTVANFSNSFQPQLVMFESLATNWITVHAYCNISTTNASIRGIQAAGTTNNVSLGSVDLLNTSILIGTAQYITP